MSVQRSTSFVSRRALLTGAIGGLAAVALLSANVAGGKSAKVAYFVIG